MATAGDDVWTTTADRSPELRGDAAAYDDSAGPSTSNADAEKPDGEMEVDTIDPLDRPLDEYKPAVPEHVTGLLGRMGQGKVYLLEESPALLHQNQEQRIRGDPRIAALADQLNQHDPTEWLVAASAGSSSPIRPAALFVRSDLIKHLSTSKVFSWVTSVGASVMGIEWLNDTTLNLIFSTSANALLALSLLAKAGFDPAEGDDPLIERSAHSIPIHLLPVVGLDPADRREGQELLGATSSDKEGGVRKRGRGAFRSGESGGGGRAFGSTDDTSYADEVEAESRTVSGIQLQEGVDPTSRITIRFALEEDKKHRKQATESEWYQRHGRRAGKETSERKRDIRENRYEDQFNGFPTSNGGEEAGEGYDVSEGRDMGRELQRRIKREKRAPYARPDGDRRNGGGRARTNADDLDRELERFARAKAGEVLEDEPERRRPSGRRNGSGRGSKEDLDRELDEMLAARGR